MENVVAAQQVQPSTQQALSPPPPPTVTGEVVSVRFHAPDSGFTIANVSVPGTGIVTIKGVFDDAPSVGVVYALYGAWVVDPTYGRQLAVDSARVVLPTDARGITKYLDEHCSYIGDKTARAIVDKYGSATLDVLKRDPARVAADIDGLTLDRAARVADELRANEAAEANEIAIADLLAPCGIGPALRRRAAKCDDTVVLEAVKAGGKDHATAYRANPYLLSRIDGIGFKKADMVATRLGVVAADARRVRAGVTWVLDEMTRRDGHVRIPASALSAGAVATLLVDASHVNAMIVDMVGKRELVGTAAWDVYLPQAYADECFVAEKLRALLPLDGKRVNIVVGATGNIDGLAEDQQRALAACAASGVFVLTGAPGTGKTYTIKRILGSFPRANTALAAPTGKAAKRMTEMSGMAATTIHRLLGPNVDAKTGKFRFEYNVYNKLPVDLLVIDEASMVDNWLMARLLEAVDVRARVIIVGDHYQLPSVGPGNVLRDMIASGVIPTVELTTIKRQDAGYIVKSCHAIKAGGDIVAGRGEGAHDLQFVDLGNGCSEHDVAARVVEYVDLFRRTGWDAMKQVQVITALREKTAVGCASLNGALQRLLNGTAAPHEGTVLRVGDKVIQTKNDYNNDIVNGDIGYVVGVHTSGRKRGKVEVAFENPDRVVLLPVKGNRLELAYAVTCHKFQGSECDVVVIPVHACLGNVVVQRSWLYTAISRAKRCCVLVGDRSEVERIVARTRSQERWTGLVEALRGCGGQAVAVAVSVAVAREMIP